MTAPKSESALFKEALLDTIIPDDTTASITDLLNTSGEHEELDDTSLLQIKQRKLLFYGTFTFGVPSLVALTHL